MEVWVGGLGRTTRACLSSTRSSTLRSSPLTGSLLFSEMYCSIKRRSKTFPGPLSVDCVQCRDCWMRTAFARGNWCLRRFARDCESCQYCAA